MTDHSSITSVTEEDISDESDTTETSTHSKASDGVSSILYSSECNTDDKLTPSLNKISISKHKNCSSKKRLCSRNDNYPVNDHSETSTGPPFPYPYGCNPLPFNTKQNTGQPRKKQKRSLHSHSLAKASQVKSNFHKPCYLPKQEEENFGVDDPHNYLYTDFSDTSSKPLLHDGEDEGLDSDDDDNDNESDNREYFPDFTRASWVQARCFDHYWSHYSFVMDWYRQHVTAVQALSRQHLPNFMPPYATSHNPIPSSSTQPFGKRKSKCKRSKSRARNRRLAKAKQKALQREEEEEKEDDFDGHPQGSETTSLAEEEEEEEEELEMEITDDMMDFFAASFKHRMERDTDKNTDSEAKQGIGSVQYDRGASGSRVCPAPMEQPGVRRTSEMKMLYGAGSPMIQGMETALQMTYDNVLDRHQPKPWPNMPLKIVFAKKVV